MNRITQCLAQARAQNRKAVIPYLVAGDPDRTTTIALMHSLVREGADIIELGIPFSDPSSDGTVIQLGAERALRQGTRLRDVIDMVAEFRSQDTTTPIVLMGYLNPIEIMGYETFAQAASEAGVDGVLVVDLPVHESAEFFAAVRPRGLDTVFLVAPTTTEARTRAICEASSGYIYYVSLKGVTGAAIVDKEAIAQRIEGLRGLTDLPIVVGFGIKDATSAREMAEISDGVIIGSALVQRIARLQPGAADETAIRASTALIGELRQAVDQL
jgi:tryptophan synthase alpha chain